MNVFFARKPFSRFLNFCLFVDSFPVAFFLRATRENYFLMNCAGDHFRSPFSLLLRFQCSIITVVFFLLLNFHFPTQQRYILFKKRMKIQSAGAVTFGRHYNPRVNNICRANKIFAFLLPPDTCKCWAKKTVGTKTILTKGGTAKRFNTSLMNKLIRIE